MTRKKESRAEPHQFRGKRISEEEASVRHRYGSVKVLRDGRVRFSAKTLPGIPELDFSVEYSAGLADGTYILHRTDYAVDARWPGNESFFVLWVFKHRVQSSCFNFQLTPDELRKAVSLLRKAGGGIERWIVPGLELTRDNISWGIANRGGPTEYDQPNLERLAVIEELLKENRDLPIAEPWTRQKRERERWEKQQAKKAAASRKPRKTVSAKARGKHRTA